MSTVSSPRPAQERFQTSIARCEHVTINANCRSDNLKPAPLAQSAERLHGKEKVYGSIP